jgi:hypothetical protein
VQLLAHESTQLVGPPTQRDIRQRMHVDRIERRIREADVQVLDRRAVAIREGLRPEQQVTRPQAGILIAQDRSQLTLPGIDFGGVHVAVDTSPGLVAQFVVHVAEAVRGPHTRTMRRT